MYIAWTPLCLIGLFSAGATGGQVDKVPVQVEGEEDENQAPPPQTEEREEPQELTFNPPPSGSSTMTQDGAPSGFSIPQESRLGVYDRGRRPGLKHVPQNSFLILFYKIIDKLNCNDY